MVFKRLRDKNRFSPVEVTIKICRKFFKNLDLSPYLSPLYTLLDNSDVPPGVERRYDILRSAGYNRITEFMEGEEWLSFTRLAQDSNLDNLGMMGRLQIAHFIRSLPPPIKFLRNLRTLEEENIKEAYSRGTLSRMYGIVMETSIGDNTALLYLSQRENELRKSFTEKEKKKGLKLVHYSVVSTKYH